MLLSLFPPHIIFFFPSYLFYGPIFGSVKRGERKAFGLDQKEIASCFFFLLPSGYVSPKKEAFLTVILSSLRSKKEIYLRNRFSATFFIWNRPQYLKSWSKLYKSLSFCMGNWTIISLGFCIFAAFPFPDLLSSQKLRKFSTSSPKLVKTLSFFGENKIGLKRKFLFGTQKFQNTLGNQLTFISFLPSLPFFG